MAESIRELDLCPVCGLPPEYCEFGPKFDLCKPWLKENHLDLYPQLEELEVTDEMKEATVAAMNVKDNTLVPKKKDPKQDKKEKVLLFSSKTRQKHKHVTTVAGLELFTVDVKAATKTFGKKFSCGSTCEKNAENLMEISIQGEVMLELAELINSLYEIPKECMYVVTGNSRKKLF